MYQHQFKKWGISKNMKQKEKDEMLELIAQEGLPPRELGEGYTTERIFQKLRRHARDKRRGELRTEAFSAAPINAENVGEDLAESSTDSSNVTHQGIRSRLMEADIDTETAGLNALRAVSKCMSEEEYLKLCVPSRTRALLQVKAALGYNSNESARLKLGFPSSSPSPPPAPILRLDADDTQFEPLLQSLQELWKISVPNHLGKQPTGTYLGPEPSSQASHFWSSVRHGLHILNISSPEMAWPMISQALQDSADAIVEQPLYFVRELFVTLSPANTDTHPEMRTILLKHLCSANLPPSHPIAVILSELLEHGHALDLSLKALSTLLEMFTFIFGWTNHATLELRRAVIANLRKSGDHDQAGEMARRLLQATRQEFGHESLEARLAAAEWSHVLFDTEDYCPAAKLSLFVIMQPGPSQSFFGTRFRDTNALYAIEDMANMHAKMGEVEASIVWLEMAAQDAWDLLEDDAATGYIFDKLDPLLRQCGRTEDAEWYRQRFQIVE